MLINFVATKNIILDLPNKSDYTLYTNNYASFEYALHLAKAFEAIDKGVEFTVKRDYTPKK